MSHVSEKLITQATGIFLRHPGEGYTRADIQNALGISKPTACRLMEELSLRLTLTSRKESRYVYYTLEAKVANALTAADELLCSMEERERMALTYLIAGRKTSLLLPEILSSLSEKLSAAGLVSKSENTILDWGGIPQEVKDENRVYIETLFSAIEELTEISIKYQRPGAEEVKEHVLQPVGLFFWDGNLYLYAYSEKYTSYLVFAFSRIQEIDLHHDKHYKRHPDSLMKDLLDDPFGVRMDEPVRTRFTIYNRQVYYEKEKKWPEDAVFTDNPDGSVTIEVTTQSHWAFKRWALSQGENIKVEAPEEMAEAIRKEHEAALSRYS